jgi:pimeloyl-ACP methyl ester carboxylesterase
VHDLIDAGPWRSLRTLRRAMKDPVEEKLSEIDALTLVVRPERDRLAPEEWSERVAELIPDSELVVLPKAGHSIGQRTATRLTALLGPFLVDPDEEAEAESEGEAPEPAPR